MSAFTALNVEPEDDVQDFVDNTKEIQLEEAFKLYTDALKLHSQGSKYIHEAWEAYDALFNCEVFKQADTFQDIERDIGGFAIEPEVLPPVEDILLTPLDDDAPSNLQQVLYLAYKNHGQFLLDCLRHDVKSGKWGKGIDDSYVTNLAQKALDEFLKALARDESDTELWRRTARIGKLLRSDAICRYCLEAAVEVDDDPAYGEVEPANLEEGFAGMQLKELLVSLSDEMALTHPIMGPYVKKEMPQRLRKYLDPYPFLKKLTVEVGKGTEVSEEETLHTTAIATDFSWQSVADLLRRFYPSEDINVGFICSTPGSIIKLEVPTPDTEMTETAEAQILQEAAMLESPVPEAVQASAPAETDAVKIEEEPVPAEFESAEDKTNGDIAASHKRSLSTAGLPETADEESVAQKRSKRMTTRKRETLNGPEIQTLADPLAENKIKYEEMGAGDIWMFQYIQGMLNKFDVETLGESAAVKQIVESDSKEIKAVDAENVAIRDISEITRKWDNQMYDTFQAANGLAITRSGGSLRASGLTAFIEHSKTETMRARAQAPSMTTDGLAEFVKFVHDNSLTIQEAGYAYFKAICPSYRHNLWPEGLKTLNMQLLNLMDPSLQSQLEEEYLELSKLGCDEAKLHALQDLAQMLLELHLDLYVSITNISSKVDMNLRAREKDRLDRCFSLVEFIALSGSEHMRPDFYWRNMWASFLYSSRHESATREHMIQCWNVAHQKMLAAKPQPHIVLHNNMAMPEISAAAADRELSRLTTMDAFLNVFSDDLHPATLIERLEPVIDDFGEHVDASNGEDQTLVSTPTPAVMSMRKFLENKGPSLRLYLWQRLRDAYGPDGIKYETKVFSCYLRSIEIIVDYIQSDKFKETSEATRHNELLGYLKTLDAFLVKALTLALNEARAFDIIDEQHLKSSMRAIASLCRILHAGSLLEDQVDSGLLADNSAPIASNKNKHDHPQTTLKSFLFRVSEMSMRSFTLLYTLVREAMGQKRTETMEREVADDLAQYLAVFHYPLGLRKRCDRSNKVFLKMMRIELIRMKFVDKWEDYLGQVLMDLFGLSLGDKAGVYLIADHGCEHEALDRRTAIQIMDHVLILAHRMQMKDLLKDDLRHTIEAMQKVIGPAKTNKQAAHNLRIINDYVRKPINPIKLLGAMKGMEAVDTLPVDRTPETVLSRKGWYFLLGMIALTRFRSVKRVAPGAIDDLKIAGTLFRTQLQFTPEHWEAWYRLAQCYDYELEEDVLWSSEKLNGDKYVRATLVNEQRGAIHCYAMAVSMAYNHADASFESVEKLSCLYHDFGTRMYASSRDPFAMEAFFVDENLRHMSGQEGMYVMPLHAELSRFKCWSFASSLFKKALLDKPNKWLTHYMLGKCYWKMMTRYDDEPDQRAILYRPRVSTLIATLEKAAQNCPKPRDSRVEPILEPHYKIVAILYKLTCNKFVTDFQMAADTIQRGRYALKKGDKIEVPDGETWEKFINDHIRHLRSLDKSNWHHRFIFRAARMVTDKAVDILTPEIATQAMKIMTTNGIFSKTMAVSVWKPEMERPGRHCVYMSRYVKYMINLQYHIPDKMGMENLVKRVRKKGTEYFQFSDVWKECATAYCRVIRRVNGVQPGQDELCKAIPAEEWAETADALEAWADFKGNLEKVGGAMFEALKEACELKKLNGTLLKTLAIDDLVVDAYATLLWDIGTNLPRLPKQKTAPVVVQHPYDARGGVMSIDGVMGSIENGDRLMPTVEIVENVRKVKHPAKREIMRRAEVLASKGGDTRVKVEKSESRKIEAKERGKSTSGGREKTMEKTRDDEDGEEDQEIEYVEQREGENEGPDSGDNEGQEEGDETGYGDETADLTRQEEDEEQQRHGRNHGVGDDEEGEDEDGDEEGGARAQRDGDGREDMEGREDGSDADDESDLSDVLEQGDGDGEAEAEDDEVTPWGTDRARRKGGVMRSRDEESRRREEGGDKEDENENENENENEEEEEEEEEEEKQDGTRSQSEVLRTKVGASLAHADGYARRMNGGVRVAIPGPGDEGYEYSS